METKVESEKDRAVAQAVFLAITMGIVMSASSCTFKIGIDYTGKTAKSDVQESPEFRNVRGVR